MAIQTRQQTNERMTGLWRTVSVTLGIVAVSAAVVAAGLGWQRTPAPPAASAARAIAAQPAPLGINLPYGANIHELSAGIRDYIRTEAQPAPVAFEQHPLGISLPQGANAAELPRGLTGYLRP